MLPVISLEIPSYALFATIGLLCAIVFIYVRMDNIHLSFRELFIYIIFCAFSSLVFARVLFAIAMIPQIEISVENIVHNLINGGIVFYGGMLGFLLGIVAASKVLKRDSKVMLDFVTPAIPLFHFFARIGCLFAGCCYGIPFWFGIINQGEDIVRFPVQGVESLCNAIIFFLMVRRNLKKQTYKNNLEIYLISYSACRFTLEFFRGDSIRGIWFGMLSTAQIVSIIVFGFALYRLLQSLQQNKVSNLKLDIISKRKEAI